MKVLSDEDIDNIVAKYISKSAPYSGVGDYICDSSGEFLARDIESAVVEKLKELLKKERHEGVSSRAVHHELFDDKEVGK